MKAKFVNEALEDVLKGKDIPILTGQELIDGLVKKVWDEIEYYNWAGEPATKQDVIDWATQWITYNKPEHIQPWDVNRFDFFEFWDN